MAAKSEKVEEKVTSRLAYLEALNNYTSSDSSDSEETEEVDAKSKSRDISFITKPEDASNKHETLPSPDGLFKITADKPDFLQDKNKGFIEWSKYVKNTTVPVESEPCVSSGHNVPPPSSYDPKSVLRPTLGFKSLNAMKRKAGGESDNGAEDDDNTADDNDDGTEETDNSKDEKRMKYF